MIKVKAQLQLYAGPDGRNTPFGDGYRPLFTFFSEDGKTSGMIKLINDTLFYPGETSIVDVYFVNDIYFNKVAKGSEFTFSEGRTPIGSGKVLEIEKQWEGPIPRSYVSR